MSVVRAIDQIPVQSLAKFATDRAGDGIFWVAPSGKFIYVNDSACKSLGYSREELLTKSVCDIDPNFPASRWPEHWVEVTQRGSFTLQTNHMTRDGRLLDVEVTVNYFEHEGHEFNCAVVRDITESKRTLKLLEENQRRLVEAQAIAHIGNWEWDVRTGNHVWSDETYRVLGYPLGMVKPRRDLWIQRLHPDDRQRVMDCFDRAMQGTAVYDVEYRIVLPDGEVRHLHALGDATRDAQGNAITMRGTVCDVTKQKRIEEQLRQREADIRRLDRIKSLGQMASGLAHELNQPLGAILNYAAGSIELLRRDDSSKQAILHAIEGIAVEAKRAGSIIGLLQNFVRKQRGQIAPVNLNALIAEALQLLDRDLRKASISVQVNLLSDDVQAMGQSVQIVQVLVNLIRNAIDAMHSDGAVGSNLTISTSCEGGFAKVEVQDMGCGMPSEQMASMFEPFFTSKPDGVGLGLSISKAIVTDLGGELTAFPREGGGMVLSFTLPLERKN